MAAADSLVAELITWASSHGAMLHPSVEVADNPPTGLSFQVRPAEPPTVPGDAIVSCPMGLTLSYLNLLPLPASHGFQTCPAASNDHAKDPPDYVAFPEQAVHEIQPHILSRLLLIREYLCGHASFWEPYIKALPQPGAMQLIPPFWPDQDRELLDATDAGIASEEIRAESRREYNAALATLQKYDAGVNWDKHFSVARYQWAYTIFSTRSFTPSLVVPDQEALVAHLPPGVELNDFSILMPLFDIGNHDPTAGCAWDVSVFNNYGFKTNAELLVGYGFTIPGTPYFHNDYVNLEKKVARSRSSGARPGKNGRIQFLVSSRPVADPSSVVAWSRRMIDRRTLSVPINPSFAYVEDAMIWDIVTAFTTPAERAAEFFPTGAIAGMLPDVPRSTEQDLERAQLGLFLAGIVRGKDGPALLESIIAGIQHRLMTNLEKLEEVNVDESDNEDELTGPESSKERRWLALDYRRACITTLETALEAINEALEPEEES